MLHFAQQGRRIAGGGIQGPALSTRRLPQERRRGLPGLASAGVVGEGRPSAILANAAASNVYITSDLPVIRAANAKAFNHPVVTAVSAGRLPHTQFGTSVVGVNPLRTTHEFHRISPSATNSF